MMIAIRRRDDGLLPVMLSFLVIPLLPVKNIFSLYNRAFVIWFAVTFDLAAYVSAQEKEKTSHISAYYYHT